MTPAETVELLKARSGFTSQPYGSGTCREWHEALEWHDLDVCMTALRAAAKELRQIALSDVLTRIPGRRPNVASPERVDAACGCGRPNPGTICDSHRQLGLAEITRIRANRAARGEGSAA